MSARSSRGYRRLLLLLPREFRSEFGPDMEQLYLDRLRDAHGATGRVLVRLEAARDVAWAAALEWTAVVRESMTTTRGDGMGSDAWMQDLRFGLRTLVRHKGFSAAVITTLALGIAANVSIFSVVNAVLLRPLPYPDGDQLVVLWNVDSRTGERSRTMDHPDIRAIQAQVPGLKVAGYSGTRPTLTGFGDPQVLYGSMVTDGLIDLMGLTPTLGRDLRADDDVLGGPAIVVIGHELWVQHLGADPDVIGRTLTLNGANWEIVGVAPPGFDYPNGSEFWIPRRHEIDGCGHGCRIINAIGRLDGRSALHDVEERLNVTGLQLAEDFPDSHRDARFGLQSMLESETSDVRTALWVLLGAVGMVLFIACANVANLLLVRATARRSEVALRATLGASRLRIVRQLLTESLLLSLAAGTLGVALAAWGTAGLAALAPDTLPRLETVSIDPSVLGFAAMLVVAVTATFGVLPALHASRDLSGSGGAGRRHAGDRDSDRSRSLLLVAEVALSLTLLLGSGLLVRTLGEIRAVDLGFDTEATERFRMSLPDTRYDSLAIGDFLLRLEEELEALPEVRAAGFGFGVPLGTGAISTSVAFRDRPEVDPADRPAVELRPATPRFLEATGTRLLRGRWFEDSDRYGAPGVAVVNQAVVRRYFPDSDPIGVVLHADVSWSFEDTPDLTIVGVVEDVIRSSPTEEPNPALYMSNLQFGANSGYVTLRLESGVTSAIPAARRAIGVMDPSLAIWDVSRLDDVVRDARATTAFYATLLTVFSVVALLLAAVGLYGVVAYSVAQRTREIGIRIALGAAVDDVTGMVLRQGIRPALLGIALGLAGSVFVARFLSSMLYRVGWYDPLTLVSVTLGLLTVVLVATALPARRAARIPASEALRSD